ncbi:MAG: hypothetical protein HZB99_03825 [Candidatus Harrisonbacteria bacterium]|nr:hypothetical protein [Candidatus Harrisonbacteria bacterium]
MKETLLKIVVTVFSLAIALTPCWLYLAVKFLLAPEGFWQNLLLLGVGAYFLGFIQLMLIIFWLTFVVKVILD